MVLDNYVKLVPGVPKRLHFTAWTIASKEITDRNTGLPTTRRSLILNVDREDGQPVSKTFSTLAEKLATLLMPDLESSVYTQFVYEIVQVGAAYQTRYQVGKFPA